MVELPRQSRRLQGRPLEYTPLEYTPSQLKGLRALVSTTDSRIRSKKVGESYIVVHPDYQLQTIEHIQEPISIFKVTGSISPSSEFAEEPEISEPDTKPVVLEPSLGFFTPTYSDPISPRVRHRITENLPSDLICIEEIVGPDEDVTLPETQETLNLREHESIFYSPFRTDAWYLSLTDFFRKPGS